MRTSSLSKVPYLMLAMSFMAVTGCGTSGTSGTADNGGSIAAKLVWGENSASKSTAKTVAAVPAGITKIKMTVSGTGTSGTAIPVVKNEIVVDSSTTEGSVSGIYPGQVTLAVQALDSAGNVDYEGYVLNVPVTAANTTDVGTIIMTPPVLKEADAECIGCHELKLDKTGQNLVAGFKQSRYHYQQSTAGCSDCHGPARHQVLDPVASGTCADCHGSKHPARTNSAYLPTLDTKCNLCHQSHNTSRFQQDIDFAVSGHGDKTAEAWAHYDFSTRDSCNACHTPEGFRQAIDTDWATTTATDAVKAGGAYVALDCKACHVGNSIDETLGVRQLSGGYTAGMGGYGSSAKATIQFPDVGDSNICIPCHAGRENGGSIIASATAGSSFKNPHYLAAAAVFYGKGGFRYYGEDGRTGTPAVTVDRTSTGEGTYNGNVPAYSSEYGVIRDGIIVTNTVVPLGATLTGENANWNHGKIGMNNYRNSGTKGQCVACHIGPTRTHSFDAYEVAKSTWADPNTPNGCFGCHGGEDMKEVAEFEEKPVFDRLMAFFKWNLEQNGIYYNDSKNPYFFTDATATTNFTNWDVKGVGTFQKTMGAAHNFKLIAAEKGAHVHNRGYMRHLIFDSIQYLQFGAATYSNTKFYGTTGSENLEDVIKFSAYSTALSAAPDTVKNHDGSMVSIQQLKSYIISSSSRTNPIDLSTGAVPSPATYGAMKYFRR